MVEKPFGHDLESARALAAEMHRYLDESQLYRIDHFLGKMGIGGDPVPALRQRDARAGLEPQPRRVGPDHDGRELRRRGPRPLLRPGRRAARRRRQPPHAGRRRRGDGGPGRAATPTTLKDALHALFQRDAGGRPGALRPRPVRRLPRHRRRRAPTRRPRPTPRCAWRSTTGAGRACRSSSAPASACRSPRPSCASCSSARRGWASTSRAPRRPSRSSSSSSSTRRPASGCCSRPSAARPREPEQISLDMEFAEEGGEGPTPYEVLLHAAMHGDSTRFTRQDGVEEAWRVMQPLLDAPPPVHPYAKGSVGARPRPTGCIAGHGRWHEPWMRRHERLRRHRHRQRRGRRHARAPPRALGQAHPAARARRLAAARAAELAGRTTSSSTTATSRRTRGTTSDGKPFQPQVHYCVGGATKLYGAALYRLREEDFGELRHHDGISPAWPIAYDEMEPYYTRAEQLYQVHGARGEDPTEPPAERAVPVPGRVSHEPRIQQLSDDLAAAGLHPFHAPCGVMLDEDDMPHSRCVRCATCDGFPCLVHAKSDAEVLGVRPALEHANVTLLTDAEAVRLETDAAGTHRHRRGRRARRRARDLHAPTSSSSPAARPTAPSCCSRRRATRTRTAWPTAPTRSGATTCSTTARRCWRCRKEPNPTVFQKTLGRQRLLLRRRRLRVPAGQHPDGRQVVRRRCTAARSRCRRGSRRSGRSTRSPATPSTSGSRPRTCRGRRTASRCARDGSDRSSATRATNDGAQAAAATTQLKSMLGHLGMHHDHLLPRHAYLKNEIPVAGVRPPGGHVPLRHRSGDVRARHRLPRARGRQPLRRRHELLPEHRRGEPGADGDGQRAARRRPPARAPGRAGSTRAEPAHVA